MTPEKFTFSRKIQDTLDNLYSRQLIRRLVFDEVHCLSQWGRSFRPSYLELAGIRDRYPHVPVLALTATANSSTIFDIKYLLKMQDCQIYRHSFNRSNLSLNVLDKRHNVVYDIADLIKRLYPNETGIIYCRTKKDCESVHRTLAERSIETMIYHSLVKPETKEKVLELWMNDTFKVVVATIAFGLGKLGQLGIGILFMRQN